MADRRAAGVLSAAALLVVAATVITVLRLKSVREEAAWRPPPASGVIPPPPLGGTAPAAAGATPRVLRVDSSGCAPVAEQGFTAAMSLDSVAKAGGIPVDKLIEGLHLPAGTSRTVPFGTLMREHRFSLRDVARVVEDYLKHC